MTKPQSYLVRMLIFLAGVCAAGFFLLGPLRDAFLANTVLNSVILGVLLTFFVDLIFNALWESGGFRDDSEECGFL